MFHQSFITAVEVLVILGALAWILAQLRRAVVRKTLTLQHQIDNEETMVLNLDFTMFDTPASIASKLQGAYDIVETRHKERFEKWQKLITEQQAANSKAKNDLKPVG